MTESGMRKSWTLTVMYHNNDTMNGDQVEFRLCADSAGLVDNGDAVFDLARPVNHLQCRLELLKDWYHECKSLHGWKCENPKSMLSSGKKKSIVPVLQAIGMRAIDVQNSCVVLAPPDCNYVALSYVWNSDIQLRLLGQNLDELTALNGLKYEALPKTIADAMHVTALIGERYLWVDALCIIQDDKLDKASQISQMDRIYRGATITIAAANGLGDEDGLPGIRHGSRSPKPLQDVHVRGLHFQSQWPDGETLVNSSKWHSRGWTYQESLMSKRLLIFTACQVFFSCETGCQTEDFVPHVIFDAEKFDPQDPRRSKGNCQPFAANNDLVTYEVGVREFTTRELSLESDGLNAISGILFAISEEQNEVFLCGLLVSTMFEHSMLWFPYREVRRRTADGARFPSWSWAGWVGQIGYVNGQDFGTNGHNYDEIREVHEWAVVLSDGGELPGSGLRDSASTMQIEHCLLKFNALSRHFKVRKSSYGGLIWLDEVHTACFQVLEGDIWVGSVILSRTLADEVLVEDDMKEHEFIVLSRSSIGNSLWLPGLTDNDETVQTTDEDGDEIDWPLFDHRKLSTRYDDPGVYNVMMIGWENNVAYRLGTGEIHIDGWNMGHPISKQVRLG